MVEFMEASGSQVDEGNWQVGAEFSKGYLMGFIPQLDEIAGGTVFKI